MPQALPVRLEAKGPNSLVVLLVIIVLIGGIALSAGLSLLFYPVFSLLIFFCYIYLCLLFSSSNHVKYSQIWLYFFVWF